jgi:hypothetical protein
MHAQREIAWPTPARDDFAPHLARPMRVAITIQPLHPLFGAEIGGVDVGEPLDDAPTAA